MMRRHGIAGVVLGVILATALSVSGQGPSSAQIQAAFRQAGLSGNGVYADSQVPTWDSASGMFLPGNGGGGGGAPSDAEYWVGAANGSLSAEKNLGALGTALVINTAGVPSAFTAQTCTNQVITALSAVGTATCTTVALGTYTSGNYTASVAGTTDRVSVSGAVGAGQAAVIDIASTYVGQTSLTTLGTVATGTWNATTVAFGKGGTGLTTAADDTTLISSGSAWVATAVTNCTDTGGNHLNYTASTNAFSCGTTSGTPTFTDNLTFTTGNALIEQNTADGSDTRSITINAGGGAGDSSRGGAIVSYGNENGTFVGGIAVNPGNVSGSGFKVNSSDGMSTWLNIVGATGVTTLSGAVTASSTLGVTGVQTNAEDFVFSGNKAIRRNTSDGTDNGVVELNGGGGTGQTRGGSISVYGNEGAVSGGVVARIGNVANAYFAVRNSGDTTDSLIIFGDDSEFQAPGIYALTVGGAANVVVTSDGQVQRSTSSARYKTNIRELRLASESVSLTPVPVPLLTGKTTTQERMDWRWILGLKVVRFNHVSNGTQEFVGLLAEDVAAKAPKDQTGRPMFVGLNAKGQPEDVAYSYLTAESLLGLREHDARLDQQLDLINGLLRRVEALEAH